MQSVQTRILPKSSTGWWSVGLAVASAAFFVLSEFLTGLQVLGLGDIHTLAVALTVVLAVMAAATCAAGVISVAASGGWSILVLLAAAFGLYSLVGTIVSLLGLPK